jgi:diguanylate cyclase (GGDEF)-like protein
MAFIGTVGRQMAGDSAVVPDLEQRIDALLRVRLSRLKMPDDIKPIFNERARKNARRTRSAWCFWVSFLFLANSVFDLFVVTRALFIVTIVFRVILGASFLAAGLLFQRDIAIRFAPVYIGLPCVLTVALAGLSGVLAHDPALLGLYLHESLIVIATAIMFIGLDMSFNIGLSVVTLLMIAIIFVYAGDYPDGAKLQTVFFDSCTLAPLIYGRQMQNLVFSRMFLLNLRDELRNSQASMRHARLASIAYTDPLTEIPNRRYFDEICASMSDMTLNLLPLSICMIDIDHFKLLNDKLGHLQGDRCLKLVAATIRNNLRNQSDIVARFGGEEFVLLLPATDMNTAYEVAERVRAAVMDLAHPNPGAPTGIVTASIGVAELAKPPIILHPLLQNADHALYRAKITGRNRVST